MKSTDFDARYAFDTAHTAAADSNVAAGQDVEVRQLIVEKLGIRNAMDRCISRTKLYFFSFLFLIVAVAECIASWELYKLFLKGRMDVFGLLPVPFALFAAITVVTFGIINAHFLRTLHSDIAQYELNRSEADNPHMPMVVLHRRIQRSQRTQHLIGFVLLIALSAMLLHFSYLREVAEAKADKRDPDFNLLDATAVIFFWAEVYLGVYLIYFIKHFLLGFRIWQLERRSAHLRAVCQENTHLVAASVVELDKSAFPWSSDNEIQIAMLRYNRHNSAESGYTDPIVLGKASVLVRDTSGQAVSDAQVLGITDLDNATNPALTDLNGTASLNWSGGHALKTILVNGFSFNGNYLNGTTVILVLERKRPIGF